MRIQTKFIPTPGSIVEAFVSTVDNEPRLLKVKKVIMSHSNDYLFEYIPLRLNHAKEHCIMNCCLITKVIKHNRIIPKKINYYARSQKEINKEGKTLKYNKGHYWGTLPYIVYFILSKENVKVQQPVDIDKLYALYNKTKEGFCGCTPGISRFASIPIFNKKRIKKWVLKNYPKFLKDVNSWNAEIKKNNEEIEAQYWEDVENELFD